MADFEQIKQLVGSLRNAKSPGALMQQLIQRQNPQLAQALDLVRQHGNDPRAAFEALARERGMNQSDIDALMK